MHESSHTAETMTHPLANFLEAFYGGLGCSPLWSHRFQQLTLVLLVFLFSLLVAHLCKKLVVPATLKIVEKTANKWDDYLINQPVLDALCRIIPSVVLYILLPLCIADTGNDLYIMVDRVISAYIAYGVMRLIATFLKNATDIVTHHLNEHHLVGMFQFLRLLTFCLGTIVIVALLFGNDPVRMIAGLGAAATVLMLVFKDSLLGLVAGIQLSANNMLSVGDWITIKQLGVDGIVEQVSLTTVKIRNFDNTISTVPPYTLVSDSFQNWRGMFDAEARRVKRALYVDIHSIRHCTHEEKETLLRKKLISKADAEDEQATNLTLFRHFVVRRLKDDPKVGDGQWVLARQLDPTPHGLPLEIWFYLRETQFVQYESQAADFMELFVATLPLFGLRHYQAPSGNDLLSLSASRA